MIHRPAVERTASWRAQQHLSIDLCPLICQRTLKALTLGAACEDTQQLFPRPRLYGDTVPDCRRASAPVTLARDQATAASVECEAATRNPVIDYRGRRSLKPRWV